MSSAIPVLPLQHEGNLQPLRIVLAFLIRIWQAFGYMSLYPLQRHARCVGHVPARPDIARGRTRTTTAHRHPKLVGISAITVIYMFAMAVMEGGTGALHARSFRSWSWFGSRLFGGG